jgi:hypothetical protein
MATKPKPPVDDDNVLPPADLAAGDPPVESEAPPADPPAEPVAVEAPKKAYAAEDFTAYLGSDYVPFKKGAPIVDSGQLWQLIQFGHPIEFR